jgi:endoglucanase
MKSPGLHWRLQKEQTVLDSLPIEPEHRVLACDIVDCKKPYPASSPMMKRPQCFRILTFSVFAVLFARPIMGGARVVAVDQVGYLTVSAKYVFSSQAADSFVVEESETGGKIFHGPMILWKSSDPATGRMVYRGDFSTLRETGRYRIVTSHGDTSSTFAISDSVYNDVFRKALKGFYFQRCGMSLDPAYAGAYQHPACHQLDALFHSSTDTSGYHPTTGGWHDAGDFGKYVVNAGISVGTLLLAYDLFPSRFNIDDLGIPESGNGIPDILDEVRYELEWFLTMQRNDGGFWFKVTREQFAGFMMPQYDTGTRYIYEVSTTATGDAVAVLARAARLFAPFDSTFSRRCLEAAILGWEFLSAHPDIVPGGGFRNPSGTNTGEYGDGDDSDERLWAAAELFETTGVPAYHTYFQGGLIFGSDFSSAMWWGNLRPLGLLTYLRSQQPAALASVRDDLRSSLISYCVSEASRRNSSGYLTVLLPGDYTWGSNSGALNAAVLLLAGGAESGDSTFMAAAVDQLHYVLGVNGLSRCFVTGVGENPPRQPHHRPSVSDGVADPVPGLLVGGPDQFRDDAVLQALYTTSTPPALCYADSLPSYASNEIAINWNAPLVFVAGYFHGGLNTTGIRGQNRLDPTGFILEQNFPNPFNGATRIRFFLPSQDDLQLRVVDILGRAVFVRRLGILRSGNHELTWQGTDMSGRPVSSGVYFYSLRGKLFSDVRKLILAK